MSPKLKSLLNAQLASEPYFGPEAPQRIYALTMIAGSPENSLAVSTEATRECGRILREECRGLILSKPDGSRLAQDLAHLPRARAAVEARSIGCSTVLRQSRGAE
jgi:hypothetical protein